MRAFIGLLLPFGFMATANAQSHQTLGNRIDAVAESNCLNVLEPEDAALIDELDSINKQAAAGQITPAIAESLAQNTLNKGVRVQRPNGSVADNPARKKILALAFGFRKAANLKRALRNAAEDLGNGKALSANRLAFLRSQAVEMGLGATPDEAFSALMTELKTSGAQVAAYRKQLRAVGLSYDENGAPDLSDFQVQKLKNNPALRSAFVSEFPDADGQIDAILANDRFEPIILEDAVFLPTAGRGNNYSVLSPSDYHEAILTQLRIYTETTGFRVFNSKQGGGISGLGSQVGETLGGPTSAGTYYRQAQQTDGNTAARAFNTLSRTLGVGSTNPALLKQLARLSNEARVREASNLDAVQSSLRKNAAAVVATGAILPFVAGASLTAAGFKAIAIGAGIAGAATVGESALTSYQNQSNFLCELSRNVDENGALQVPLILAGAPLAKLPGAIFQGALRNAPNATKALYGLAAPATKAAAAALRIGAVRQLILGGAIAAPTAYFAKASENHARALEAQASEASADGHTEQARALQRSANSARSSAIVTAATGLIAQGTQVAHQIGSEAKARAQSLHFSEFKTNPDGVVVNSRSGLAADLNLRPKSKFNMPETPGVIISAPGRERNAQTIEKQFERARATGNTVFVGDIHLEKGAGSEQNLQSLVGYVGKQENGVERVVIGGDIVDINKVADNTARLKRAGDAVKTLRTALDGTPGGSAKKIDIIIGNHDIGRKTSLTSALTGKEVPLVRGRFDLFGKDGKVDLAKAETVAKDFFGGRVSAEQVAAKYAKYSFTDYGQSISFINELQKIPGVRVVTQDFNENAVLNVGGSKIVVGHVPQARGPNLQKILGSDFDFDSTIKLKRDDDIRAIVTFDKHTTGYVRGYKLDSAGRSTGQAFDVITNPALVGDANSRALGNPAAFTVFGHETKTFHFVEVGDAQAPRLLDLALDELAYTSPAQELSTLPTRTIRNSERSRAGVQKSLGN